MIHLYEIDNDGRGPNVYEISDSNGMIATITADMFRDLVDYYRVKGVGYQVHTVEQYYIETEVRCSANCTERHDLIRTGVKHFEET